MRKQSILIFSNYGPGAEICVFFPMTMLRTPPPEVQKTQWPYLGSWAKNQKIKDTFFSSTFKVWKSKVSIFFKFMVQGRIYWHFVHLTIPQVYYLPPLILIDILMQTQWQVIDTVIFSNAINCEDLNTNAQKLELIIHSFTLFTVSIISPRHWNSFKIRVKLISSLSFY